MQPYWFKPDHQPKPEEPVEFQIRPLDLGTAYDTRATMHANGMIAREMVSAIFLTHVIGWRGIAEPCSPSARQQILRTAESLFGFDLCDWLIWTGHVARHAYLQACMTEEERKNS